MWHITTLHTTYVPPTPLPHTSLPTLRPPTNPQDIPLDTPARLMCVRKGGWGGIMQHMLMVSNYENRTLIMSVCGGGGAVCHIAGDLVTIDGIASQHFVMLRKTPMKC